MPNEAHRFGDDGSTDNVPVTELTPDDRVLEEMDEVELLKLSALIQRQSVPQSLRLLLAYKPAIRARVSLGRC